MLTLTSGNGNDYGCIIENTNDGLVTLSVCYKQANNSEPSVKVTLYQGVPKQASLRTLFKNVLNSEYRQFARRLPTEV